MAVNFDALIEHWDPILRRAFMKSIAQIRDMAQIDQIARMLEAGDVDGALEAVRLNPVAFRIFERAISDAFEAGGISTAGLVPELVDASGLRTVFQFNIRNLAAEAWLRDYSATLVTEILDDQRVMIRQFLERAMSEGLNPRTAALDLVGRVGLSGSREGGLIGLTSTQEQWVNNYADELMSDNPADALTRTLRDKRFDSTVLDAADSGEPLTADQIDNMVTSYTNRALRYRAENIARTEAMNAVHESQKQALEQAVSGGIVEAKNVTQTWHTAEDDRVRYSHAMMDGQTVLLGQSFISGNGNLLDYPGDGPPEESINCRCWVEPSISFLDGVT